MDIDWLRKFCSSLPGTTEDIKWGNDLCFLVGEKMFCVVGLDHPQKVVFKVPDEVFEELSTTEGFVPAPYLARAKWVMVQDIGRLSKKEWQEYIQQSYTLIRRKLSKKLQKELGFE
jgi:predicted DNA-binding protein (MmcQ/YjbR family)